MSIYQSVFVLLALLFPHLLCAVLSQTTRVTSAIDSYFKLWITKSLSTVINL